MKTDYIHIVTKKEVSVPIKKTLETPYFYRMNGQLYGILNPTQVLFLDSSRGFESIRLWNFSADVHFSLKHEEISEDEFMDEYERIAQYIRDTILNLYKK